MSGYLMLPNLTNQYIKLSGCRPMVRMKFGHFFKGPVLQALMPQAVLWDIKFGRRTMKILIDEFFDIPLLLAKKKFFFDPPCWCCLTGGRGESAFWGVSDVG